MSGYIAPRRLYLDRTRSKVVEEDDPEAAFLLAAEGHPIPEAEARRLGLIAGKAVTPDENTVEDKAVRPARTKGSKKGQRRG